MAIEQVVSSFCDNSIEQYNCKIGDEMYVLMMAIIYW